MVNRSSMHSTRSPYTVLPPAEDLARGRVPNYVFVPDKLPFDKTNPCFRVIELVSKFHEHRYSNRFSFEIE